MNIFARVALIIVLLSIITLSLYNLSSKDNSQKFISKIENQRAEKDIWLGSDLDSPFLVKNASFHRLNYYPPNLDYVINADFSRRFVPDSVTLITSTGEKQAYLIYGDAKFILDNTNCTLVLLTLPGEAELFIPFMDATSGKSTYGAGRYLEAALPSKDKVILNFNLAYNPYCAYMDGYTCPLPPKSNVLKAAIKAGEKSYN